MQRPYTSETKVHDMRTHSSQSTHTREHGNRSGKYLSFHLGDEEYAIQVLKVREIVKLQHITGVPETPPELKGVINLRGKVIPVVDLRLRFGLSEKALRSAYLHHRSGTWARGYRTYGNHR